MIKFESESEAVLDAKPDGVLVIPVNTQGILEHTVVGRRFKNEFPNSFGAYGRLVYMDKLKVGECVFMEENGFKIALIVYAASEIGMFKDKEEDKATAFGIGVDSLLEQTKSIGKYYSGVVPVKNVGTSLIAKVKGSAVTWVVHKE